jgi:tetratricopeptide (TPR) repeat protein
MDRSAGRDGAAARRLGTGLVLAWLGACSARAPVVAPPAAVAPDRTEIDALVHCGSHECLSRALELAQERHRRLPERADFRDDATRVALLLALRERQLGILGDRGLTAAHELLAPCVGCAELRMLARGVELTGPNVGGVHQDLPRADFDWRRLERTREAIARWRLEGLEQFRSDPAASALCLGLTLSGSPGEERPPADPGARCGAEAHDECPLVLFSLALARGGDPTLARRALTLEPRFQEAHLLLGHGAKAERRMGLADEHYARAFEALPESVAAGMALADLSFSLEAWRQALDVYEQVTVMAPEHREAHLRQGIVLTFLGQPQEAVAPLDRLLELGFWLLGEAHYWLARNKAELGMPEEATDHIEQAEHYLPDDPRVHELAGRLAFEAGAAETAEGEYLQVIEIDSRWPGRYSGHEALCGSLSGLARIASAAKRWKDAAGRFEGEAECQSTAAELVSAEIAAIRTWGLSPTREAVLVGRKERARQSLKLRDAAALYNAAACAANAGERVRATALAERAARHPAYTDKAEALVTRIRPAAF